MSHNQPALFLPTPRRVAGGQGVHTEPSRPTENTSMKLQENIQWPRIIMMGCCREACTLWGLVA